MNSPNLDSIEPAFGIARPGPELALGAFVFILGAFIFVLGAFIFVLGAFIPIV
jgi:hypothetical protein